MAIAGNSNGELEKKLWETAEKLRGPVDPSNYKDFALGLLFLKSMSDSFEKRRQELEEKTRDPDSRYYTEDEQEREYILTDKDEYRRENVFYLPEEARWQYFVDNATDPQIGKKIDDAMRSIEEENPRLKGILPKGYSRSSLASNGSDALEGLINLFADIEMEGENGEQDEDIFGRVYEYFIKKFAMEGGQKGGEFYTPKSVVELLVEILEPFEGRIFDPFSGSGGMFVQSQKFIEEHGGDTDKISIYGQEIKESTLQISKMNLYLRGLDGSIKQGDSIRNDQHKGLEADYVITNPPFNMEEWGRDAIADDDPRFRYGLPPESNANFAFMQHMLNHLNEHGMVSTVMAEGSLSAKGEQASIRKKMIEDDVVDAIISLPKDLFYTTGISVCLWILSNEKENDEYRDRSDETLFIDASDMYESVNQSLNVLSENHIEKIASTVHAYQDREDSAEYKDINDFCKIASLPEIQSNDFILSPSRYIDLPEKSRDVPAQTRIEEIKMELEEINNQSNVDHNKIMENLDQVDSIFSYAKSSEDVEKKPFSEIAEFINGNTFSSDDWVDEGEPIIKISELNNGIKDSTDRYAGEADDKYKLEPGSILFAWSASIGIYVWTKDVGLLNQHIWKIVPDEGYSREFLYAALMNSMDDFMKRAHGTTTQHINKSDLDEVKTPVFDPETRENITKLVEPVLQQKIAQDQKSELLDELDELLIEQIFNGGS